MSRLLDQFYFAWNNLRQRLITEHSMAQPLLERRAETLSEAERGELAGLQHSIERLEASMGELDKCQLMMRDIIIKVPAS